MSTRADNSEADDGATMSTSAGARWQFGPFELNEKRMELRRAGALVRIETKPLNLLMLFVRNPGALITKNDLVDALWPNGIANDAMLGSCVAKLRSALGEDGGTLVRNVFGHGYRFDAEPRRLAEPAAIAPPSLDLKAGDAPPLRPNWRLVRRLGLSGDSWLVEHVKSRARRVFKFSNDAAGLSALKREVTIFRLLRESLGDRPCYVDLLDWNFDTAPWFIEAEYCPAGSLQEWCIAQGGAEHVPFATRLDLVIQIAEALSAVHAVGVLHKDLKPANVFVVIGEDGRPNARLADFGASSLHDSVFLQRLEITRAGFTQMLDSGADGRAGTLLYLAPEVAAGQPATVRADVYALGLILYQLVIGSLGRQLSSGWEAEVGDELLREDIAAATAGDPERRLADAGELARRLRSLDERRRAVADARAAAEAAERAARRAERARARRAGLIAAFVTLLVGLIVSSWLYVDARTARDVAERQAQRAELAQRRAEKVSAFLGQDMFSAATTDDRPVRDLTVRELLTTAMQAVPIRFNDDSTTAAAVYESLGRSFIALDYGDQAAGAIEAALAIHEKKEGVGAEITLRLTEEIVGLKWPLGELPDRLPHYEAVMAAGRERLGPDHPAVVRLRVSLARGRIQLGQWRQGADELNAALDSMMTSAAYDASYRNLVKRSLAYVLVDLGRHMQAEQMLNEVIESEIRDRGPRHLSVAYARMRLGRVLYETGRLADARRELELAEDISTEWSRADGSAALTVRTYLAWLDFYAGDYSRAESTLRSIKALVVEQDAGGFDQSYTESRPLALVLARLGRRNEAIRLMNDALASARKTLNNTALGSDDHPLVMLIARDLEALQAGAEPD